MLDEKDLQAIAQLMEQQRKDIMHDVKVLLDTEVSTKFNLLAEGIEDIQRRMPSEDVSNLDTKETGLCLSSRNRYVDIVRTYAIL